MLSKASEPYLSLAPALLSPFQVCKYIDIPLQHISNLTLLAMNRPPQAHTLKLLGTLRERIPGLALRTTFISGFPGMLAAPSLPLLLVAIRVC